MFVWGKQGRRWGKLLSFNNCDDSGLRNDWSGLYYPPRCMAKESLGLPLLSCWGCHSTTVCYTCHWRAFSNSLDTNGKPGNTNCLSSHSSLPTMQVVPMASPTVRQSVVAASSNQFQAPWTVMQLLAINCYWFITAMMLERSMCLLLPTYQGWL